MTIIAVDWDDLLVSGLWLSLQYVNKYDGDNIEEKASTGLLVKVDTIVCLRGTDLGTESAKVPRPWKAKMHLVDVLVQNISHYGVNVTNIDEMLASKVELFLVVFFQSELQQGEETISSCA